MKPLLLFFVIALTACCTGQNNRGEFAINSNGLMYNDADMKQLRFIVDSLNLKFKTCPLNKPFYSCPQARVYYVLFKSNEYDLQEIKKDIDAQTGFNEVIKKYSAFVEILDTSRLLIRTVANSKEDGDYYYLNGDPYGGYSGFYWDKKFSKKDPDFVNKWVYDYSSKRRKDDYYRLEARFFPEKLRQSPIPSNLGQLIQYVDCMIDTNAVIYLTNKYSGGYFIAESKSPGPGIARLVEYVGKKMSRDFRSLDTNRLDEHQMRFAINSLSNDLAFRDLLAQTIDAYVSNRSSHYQLEELAQKSGMYDKALLMKRSHKVMGQCSQDISPRLHAKDIATLAAQSHSWDIFLRAHLDIMNDRFERASDGSYAYGDRKTYLKELEELNLNIVDLMLGLTLRADNVADNHYYGTVWRIGWALTESKEKDRFEQSAISILKNNEVDEFNRGLVFLLLHTYIGYLDEKEQKEKIDSLKAGINSFPVFLHSSINKLRVRNKNN